MSWVALMYHDVQSEPASPTGGPGRFTVSTGSFALMLDTIAAEGYTGCSLEEARHGDAGRRVAITFDDGTIGQFEHAAPALRERGMTATFFVVTDWVGTEGFISWDQLREMREWGMSIQSHSKSHPHLSELDGEALRFELEESRREIDAALGQRTTEIALPGGNAPKPHLRRVIGASGYEAVASSRWGANPDRSGQTPRRIHRCNVPRDIDAELAARIVKGDRALVIRHYPREAVLNGVRALLGADRYARWRRRFLNAVAGS